MNGSILLHTAVNPSSFPRTPSQAEHRATETRPMSSPEPKSPLTIIAIFAGIIEASALASLPFLDESSQSIYTWFLVGFPPFLTLLFFLTLNFNTKSLYGPDEAGGENSAAETENLALNLSEKTEALQTSPTLGLGFSHTPEQSTVVVSGADAQALLEVIARHALRKTKAGSVTVHDLDRGTRVSIVTDIPQNHPPPQDGQKKTRQ